MESKPSVLTKRYDVGRCIGQGTFAKVYFGRSIATNQSVAIKMIDKERIIKSDLVDQIKREISVMRIVKHPNIIKLYEVIATKTKIFFIMEYAKGGELFNKVAKGKLHDDTARKFFRQLIEAVDFCHNRGVFHRDIKPENILLDEFDTLKVSDFGLSALSESVRQDGLLHTTCGTPAYVAPEVINRRGYDGAKADVWSCGVVLYVLLAGFLPFHDSNLIEMYRKIGRGEFKFPSWFSMDAKRFILKILDPNPITRISIAKIKEHPWYRKEAPAKSILLYSRMGSDAGTSSENVDGDADASPRVINAFDIISLSSGFDLSKLFEDTHVSDEARFTSLQPAGVILEKLEEVAVRAGLRLVKKEAGLLKLGGKRVSGKCRLEIDAEIFEVNPSFHFVEFRRVGGDPLEYRRILMEEVKPALHDIVWVWPGDDDARTRTEDVQE